MTKPVRISYWFIFLTIVCVGWLHLATPLLAALFSYFVLSKLSFGTHAKWFPVSLFMIVIVSITLGIPAKELKARLAKWKQPKPRYTRGVLAKYAKLTSDASHGAVTDLGL